MVDHLTLGINATGVDARVDTLEVAAGPVGRTLGVGRALGSTPSVRVAKVAAHALAARLALRTEAALGVGAAGARVAGICRLNRFDNLGLLAALAERVAVIARRALADGNMIADAALGIEATGAAAGVLTLLVDAGRVLGTLVVDDALWPSVGWSALVSRVAGAHRRRAQRLARGVRTARRGKARVDGLWRRPNDGRLLPAVDKWVALVVGRTGADRVVGYDIASGIDSAPARTRVGAPLVEAGAVLAALRADNALWPAVGRATEVAGQTRTLAPLANHLVAREGATVVVGAWIFVFAYNTHS